MKKLNPESKKIYTLEGVQLFSKTDLGKLIGVHRNTIDKNLKEWEVKPRAQDVRGNDLFSIADYWLGQNRSRVTDDGEERFGGYESAIEWKTAIDAKRSQLKLEQDEGILCNAFEAEQEFAACFADVAKMGESLLTLVDMELHPDGRAMQKLADKFKRENSKYYDQLMADTEHVG